MDKIENHINSSIDSLLEALQIHRRLNKIDVIHNVEVSLKVHITTLAQKGEEDEQEGNSKPE